MPLGQPSTGVDPLDRLTAVVAIRAAQAQATAGGAAAGAAFRQQPGVPVTATAAPVRTALGPAVAFDVISAFDAWSGRRRDISHRPRGDAKHQPITGAADCGLAALFS